MQTHLDKVEIKKENTLRGSESKAKSNKTYYLLMFPIQFVQV